MTQGKRNKSDIAVVGMACWYPGSRSLREFWENILARRQQFRRMPDNRLPLAEYHDGDKRAPDKTYGTQAAVLDGFMFDWRERRIPKSAFESTDIVHWLALEVALKALDDSGLALASLQQQRTGVILGNTLTGEWTRTNAMRLRWPFVEKVLRTTAKARGEEAQLSDEFVAAVEQAYKSVFPAVTEDTLAGALSNTIAGRICNVMDLKGGGYTVDGACSSSLLSLITAARNLANDELDVAFAGGLDISLDTFELIGFAKVGALSADEMRVYDKRANGFIPGEGCGFVVLKRLADAERDGDKIYAVLKGWGISSDGKGGLTAPTIDGQAQAIGDAYRLAGYELSSVSFIEGHGTGTTLGDKVEISALNKVLGSGTPERRIGMTSLKSVMGHTKAAAGIGGFIKAALAVNQRVAPPTAGVDEPNELFAGQAKNFVPLLLGRKYPESQVIRAGVSAMGFGGINTHVTLESYGEVREEHRPLLADTILMNSHDQAEVLVFSGHSQSALRKAVDEVLEDLRLLSRAELVDLAQHLTHLYQPEDSYRGVVVCRAPENAYQALLRLKAAIEAPLGSDSPKEGDEPGAYWAAAKVKGAPKIAMVFPGQGSQRPKMAHEIARRSGWAQRLYHDATRIARGAGDEKLLDALDDAVPTARLSETETVQPYVTVANALTFEHLRRLGVTPSIVAGHSLGELTALYAAGSFNFQTLIKLATARGQLMGKSSPEHGSMVYLSCDQSTAEELCREVDAGVVIANLNSHEQTVVSGQKAALDLILKAAEQKHIKAAFLPVAGAFHSPLMSKAAAAFAEHLAREALRAPRISVIRGVDGKIWNDNDRVDNYLSEQITNQVNFVAISRTLSQVADVILEVGPGSVLSNLIKKNLGQGHKLQVLAVDPKPGSSFDLKSCLARLFVRGSNIRFAELHEGRFSRAFVSPRQRLFIESPTERDLGAALAVSRPALTQQAPTKAPAASASKPDDHAAAQFAMPVSTKDSIRPSANSTVTSAPPLNTTLHGQADQAASTADGMNGMNAMATTATTAATADKATSGIALSYEGVLAGVLQSVANITSFDVATLNPEMRLLDDLNLDSIKLTELVFLVGQSQGLEGFKANIENPNMSLKEFAQMVLELAPNTSGSASPAPEERLVTATPAMPAASSSSPPNEPVRTKTLAPAEPAKKLNIVESTKSKNRRPWVRNFTERFVPEVLTIGSLVTWPGVKVAVLGSVSDEHDLARGLAQELKRLGAEVTLYLEGQDLANAMNLADQHCSIACLPAIDEGAEVSIALLSKLAQGRMRQGQKLVVLQLDDGHFGQSGLTHRRASGKAFAQSLAHERQDLHVTALSMDLHFAGRPDFVTEKIKDELGRSERLAVVGYNKDGARSVATLTLDQRSHYQNRPITVDSHDVVIVTGGGKGITAACALALGEQSGARMALVGSSKLSAADRQNPEHPIAQTLREFAERGVEAEYFACDIQNQEAVRAMIDSVTAKFGRPSVLVHGAGINVMRPASTVSALEARKEYNIKVQGLANLLAIWPKNHLKIAIGLGSIIGVIGMPGNSWYGFANEAMDLCLRHYRSAHPGTETATLAFSVWSEIGMGARMGSDKHLEAKGISAIHPSLGIERFLELVAKRGLDHQTAITSRLGEIGRGQAHGTRPEGAHDFVKDVVAFQPNVEAVARVELKPSVHQFLVDHNYKGSLLFPTVMGLEAMAQAASLLRPGIVSKDVVMENIKLTRPIPVSKQGLPIEIHAELLESPESDTKETIRVGIRCPLSGFEADHFAADFVLDLQIDSAQKTPHDPLASFDLGINPGKDLYGSILFQGPSFQRLSSVLALESDNENKGHTIYTSDAQEEHQRLYLLGDPFARDSLLQSAQITIPQNQCLPVEIARLELRRDAKAGLRRTCITDVVRTGDKTFQATIEVLAANGEVTERMSGYTLHLLEKKPALPKAMDLIPASSHRAPTVPEPSSTPDLLSPYRPVIDQLAFAATPNGPQGQGIFVRRFIPDFKTFSMLSRSIYFSHFFNWMGEAREIGLAPVLRELRDLTASGRWGMITNWSAVDILGDCRNQDRVIESRTWVSKKLMGKTESSSMLTFDWVCRGPDGELERLATGHMGFTWAEILDHGVVRPAPLPEGLKAFMAQMMAKTDAEDEFEPAKEPFRQLTRGNQLFRAPRGPNTALLLAEKSFETGLTNANLVGNVYFVNYSYWMGSIRDRYFYDVMPEIFRGIGQKGELTCVQAKIQHLREAMPFDDIRVTMSLAGVHEHGLELVFEFFKYHADGRFEKLAFGTHEAIWTKTNAQGEKVAAKLPEQLLARLLSLAEPKAAKASPTLALISGA